MVNTITSILLITCTIIAINGELVIKGQKNIITDLPGYEGPELNFKQYSGYLKGSPKKFLHFWFVESQSAPAYDPLILWLNGGPGCSSLSGFLEELGPFRLTDNVTLEANPWSWNKQANMIFLESPSGVGYSYSSDFEIATDDDTTSLINYMALKDFFRQFPQYRRHDFYIIGESYAGVYVPTLSDRILNGQEQYYINLKGIGLGNALLSEALGEDTMMEWAYARGLIDPDVWRMVLDSCCNGCADGCQFHKATSQFCQYHLNETQMFVWLGGLNPYDIYRDCWHRPESGPRAVSQKFKVALKWMSPLSVREKVKSLDDLIGDDEGEVIVIVDPTCSNETAITEWMNRPDVREALHIPYHVGYWSTCKGGIKWSYQKQYTDMSPQVRRALKNDVRVLIYNGDTDAVCNHLMGQRFSEQLGLPLTEGKRPWKYGDGQIGGFVTRYQSLDFVTIKGGGHMAPGWRPEQNYKVIDNWLKNIRLQ